MASDAKANSYEEARKQRVLENKRRFEDLGIINISKGLTKSPTKTKERHVTLKSHEAFVAEPRRSSRARTQVPSYRDDMDIELPRGPRGRKSSNFNSSWASYLARPLAEVKSATYEERALALRCAEKLESNLQSGNPSFIKSMVRSHVYSCFWLGLPTRFCERHLPKSTVDIVLEDEEGNEYDAVYIGRRSGLSGGWRGFALHYKLDDGDAVVFELIKPTRFKVYIVRASECSSNGEKLPERSSMCSSQDNDAPSEVDNDSEETETTLKRHKKPVSKSRGSIKSKKGNPTPATRASSRQQKMRDEK
ncbi:hypothetical protein Leryth_013133 [Lithospermum erythrorhizon]|nr:hypothetical protein Leryth_013133 [Lithospermum erythrorhizon]